MRFPFGAAACLLLFTLCWRDAPAQVPVSVIEDELAVPHFVSSSKEAVFWALGRQQMLDHPVSCAFHLRYASGRLAGDLGIMPGVSEAWLRVDIAHRLWRVSERVRDLHLPAVLADPVLAPLLRAYVRGLESGRAQWNANPAARDALALATSGARFDASQIQRLMSRPFSMGEVLAFALVWPGLAARAGMNELLGTNTLGTGVGFTASNGWMVNASASTSGNPMMLSDPHLPGDTPFHAPFFATLHAGSFELAGWFFPGMPFPAVGVNRDLAWTATSNAVDNWDLWRADTNTPNSYLQGTTTQPITRSTELFRFIDRTTGAPGTRLVPLAWADAARDFPIFEEMIHPAGTPYHSRILFGGATFLGSSTSMVAFLHRMAEASTTAEVSAAVATMALPDQNLLVLHRDGGMQYWSLARAPQRSANPPTPLQLRGLLDGNDPLHAWVGGIHPFSSLPTEFLPSGSGPEIWINNNVSPELTRPAGSSTINPATLPVGMNVAPPFATWRQARARQLLSVPCSLAQLEAAAVDSFDSWTKAVVPYFQSAVAALVAQGDLAPDPLRDMVLQGLGAWDGDCHPHSIEGAIAYLLRARYEKLLLLNSTLPAPFVVDDRIPSPWVTLPALSSFSPTSHPGDSYAMAIAAHDVASHLYAAVSASAPSAGTYTPPFIGPSPWTAPWSASPWMGYGPLLELGRIKTLDLSPDPSSAQRALYPVGGAKDSLLQFGSLDLPATLAESTSGGSYTASASNTQLNGSTRLLIVEFTASGPRLRFLSPAGNTEILSDPRRYLWARDFADRQLRPLHFDLPTIQSTAHSIRVSALTMP